MNLTDKEEILRILKFYNIKPDKKLGQNFLIDSKVLVDIVDAADLTSNDLVLEVGPGLGCLTDQLAKKVKGVFACEKDRNMADIVSKILSPNKNVHVFNGDVLGKEFKDAFEGWLDKMGSREFKIVSNLPYNITSFFLRTFLNYPIVPKSAVLMIQKEVAERLIAKPGQMSILGVSVQFYASVDWIREVGNESFYPRPKVDSAVIRLNLGQGMIQDDKEIDEKTFFRIVKCGFSEKRKKLTNNLYNGLKISKDEIQNTFDTGKISMNARAQELSMTDWLFLYHSWTDQL